MDFITVTVSDHDKTHSHKFFIPSNETIVLCHDDKTLIRMVEETSKKFDGKPERIRLKATFEW